MAIHQFCATMYWFISNIRAQAKLMYNYECLVGQRVLTWYVFQCIYKILSIKLHSEQNYIYETKLPLNQATVFRKNHELYMQNKVCRL